MDMRLLALAPLCLLSMICVAGAEELRVLAADSLREVMTEIGERYKAATGITVTAEFGPSGYCASASKKVTTLTCSPPRIWAIR
jgi:ABC-type molybdate transport system substrate-binding protein